MKKLQWVGMACLILIMGGCVNTSQRKAFETGESQVKIRSIQTRAFDTTDKKKMMQTVISTMQDLDFVIDKADLMLGSVTGTKFLGYTTVKMTVTVRPRGETQMLVRANAQYGIKTVEDPETYQDFFNALEKSLFLTAHQVD
jgi:hypothetical protein